MISTGGATQAVIPEAAGCGFFHPSLCEIQPFKEHFLQCCKPNSDSSQSYRKNWASKQMALIPGQKAVGDQIWKEIQTFGKLGRAYGNFQVHRSLDPQPLVGEVSEEQLLAHILIPEEEKMRRRRDLYPDLCFFVNGRVVRPAALKVQKLPPNAKKKDVLPR